MKRDEIRREAARCPRFMVRVDPALHQRLAMKAAAAGESMNPFVARALTKA